MKADAELAKKLEEELGLNINQEEYAKKVQKELNSAKTNIQDDVMLAKKLQMELDEKLAKE